MSLRYNFKVGTKVIVNGAYDGEVFRNAHGVVLMCDLRDLLLIKFKTFSWYFDNSIYDTGRQHFTIRRVETHKEFTDDEYEALLV